MNDARVGLAAPNLRIRAKRHQINNRVTTAQTPLCRPAIQPIPLAAFPKSAVYFGLYIPTLPRNVTPPPGHEDATHRMIYQSESFILFTIVGPFITFNLHARHVILVLRCCYLSLLSRQHRSRRMTEVLISSPLNSGFVSHRRNLSECEAPGGELARQRMSTWK